jgi:hypothetical protein
VDGEDIRNRRSKDWFLPQVIKAEEENERRHIMAIVWV